MITNTMNSFYHLILSGVLISLIGSLLHFVYHLSNCMALLGFFGAVNESVWEHLKLMLWPMIAWWLGVMGFAICPAAVATYSSSVFLVLVYANVSAILQTELLWFDILLFCASVFLGQGLGIYVLNQGEFEVEEKIVAAVLMLVLIALLSTCSLFYVPVFPFLFEDHRNDVYGVPWLCE
jgi:hypothetical protein